MDRQNPWVASPSSERAFLRASPSTFTRSRVRSLVEQSIASSLLQNAPETHAWADQALLFSVIRRTGFLFPTSQTTILWSFPTLRICLPLAEKCTLQISPS